MLDWSKIYVIKKKLCSSKIDTTCLYAFFRRQINIKRSQCDKGWSRCSWTPSATSSSRLTMGSIESTSYVHQKLTWHMLISYNSKTNRFNGVRGGSRCSRTPSAISTSSTMASRASTSHVHQKFTWHMFIYYFSMKNRFKTVPVWDRVIKLLSATLARLTMASTASNTYIH